MSGSTGIHAKSINGIFDPSHEIKDGYAVYTKRTDTQKCLEHHMGEWQIKPVSAKVPRPSLAFMMLLEKRCPLMCCVCREKTVATRTCQVAACWSSAPTACGGNTMARQ